MPINIICLHGFLGSPDDFNFLEELKDAKINKVNLDSLVHLSVDNIYTEIDKYLSSDFVNILVGYSFGARLSIGYFLRDTAKFEKVILFAGHAGLSSQSEQMDRLPFENKMILNLKEMNRDEFLSMWNQYAIFDNDLDLFNEHTSFKTAALYFKNYGLSKQEYFLPKLREFSQKVYWHFGKHDQKYCDYAQNCLQDFDVYYFQNAGHRLLQHQKSLLKRIKEII